MAAEQATNQLQAAAPDYARRETEWHRLWKYDFVGAGAQVEQNHTRAGLDRRADILLHSGTVIEVQRGTLTQPVCAQRELCYRRMAWIVDGTHLGDRWHTGERGVWIKQGPRWWAHLRFPRFVDLGDDWVAQIHSLDLVDHERGDTTCRRMLGRYTLMHRWDFVAWAVRYL